MSERDDEGPPILETDYTGYSEVGVEITAILGMLGIVVAIALLASMCS